jgi:hypothetical protein
VRNRSSIAQRRAYVGEAGSAQRHFVGPVGFAQHATPILLIRRRRGKKSTMIVIASRLIINPVWIDMPCCAFERTLSAEWARWLGLEIEL